MSATILAEKAFVQNVSRSVRHRPMRLTFLALLALSCVFSSPEPEPIVVPAIVAGYSDDMVRDRAVSFWARAWGVDERLMRAISETENWSGRPDALGPEFCLIRAGERIQGIGDKSLLHLSPVDSADERRTLAPGTCLRYTRAIGVMQVLPSHVSSDNARMCGASSVAKLKQTWPNACLGVLLFRDYLYECKGNVTCALEKYGGVITEAGRRASRYTEKVFEALG